MIDKSPKSNLAICEICGRREIYISYEAARQFLAEHEATSHKTTYRYRHNIAQAERSARVLASSADTLKKG